ncbi:hypothetical protein [Flavonifractor phage Chenonceau]|nr:hypothetical protein [Flavonifractor phage Chenonceau]
MTREFSPGSGILLSFATRKNIITLSNATVKLKMITKTTLCLCPKIWRSFCVL